MWFLSFTFSSLLHKCSTVFVSMMLNGYHITPRQLTGVLSGSAAFYITYILFLLHGLAFQIMVWGQVKWLCLVSVSMELIMNFAMLSPAANQTAGYDQRTRGQAYTAARWWWLCVFLAHVELHTDVCASGKCTEDPNLNYTHKDNSRVNIKSRY